MVSTQTMTGMTRSNLILPEWPAPPRVHALQSTRAGGLGIAPYDSLNLGSHVGDDPNTVEKNRNSLNRWLPSEPVWLEQVHGTAVVLAETAGCRPVADACVSRRNGAVCVVMTADCLPLLLCDQDGSVVGAAHAGWRGLAAGVIEATVSAMVVPGARLLAWLGPAIGPQAFEVGAEVRAAFLRHDPAAAAAFTVAQDKYRADIYLLARQRLNALGITRIYGGNFCTYTDTQRFFSYRRDGVTGRMGSFIWLGG